jgi:pilus assembly protein FimV
MPPGTFVRPLDRDFDDADKPGRELSVEELIDLEQQAEFFVVLGQDDAAIDLLMGLVRSSGGQSPMPYLKLLEIYRRLGYQDAYDRIRERFNKRFNGVAPSIDVDPVSGFDLTDYPDMLGRIQAAWSQPQQVLTMIERLIPRAPGDVETLFDLEAFAELLFLTRIARDLSDIESGLHGVDFLLPLDADPLITGPATMSLHAPYEPHKAMMDLTLDLDLDPMN